MPSEIENMETQAMEFKQFTQADLSAPTFENFWNGTLVQMPRNPIDQVNDQVKIEQLTENERKVFFLIKSSDQVNDQLTTGYIASKLDLSYSTIQRILRVLKQRNMILRVGSDKKGYWSIKE